jgi:hypothetical protein
MNNQAIESGFIFFFNQYPYLGLGLFLFLWAVFFWILIPDQRWPMVLSGILSMPYALASIVFVPEYWTPVRLINGVTGLEDLLFSLSNGTLAWALAAGGFAKSWRLNLNPSRMARRYLIFTLSGIALSLIVWFSGLKVMTAALISIVGLGLYILSIYKDLWIISLLGMVGFSLLYGLVLKGVLSLNPEFLYQWNLANLSEFRIVGIPSEEIQWALGFGAVWPLFMVYVFDGRLVRKRLRT